MRTLRTLLALALICLPAIPGDASQGPSAAESDVLALERRIADAYVNGDPTMVQDLLADDLIVINPMGQRTGKKELLAEITSQRGRTIAFGFASLDASVFGDTAVAIGKYNGAGKQPDGREYWMDEFFTDVWVKRNGRWQLVECRKTAAQAAGTRAIGETTAKVRDGWGDEVVVRGFEEVRQPDGKWFVHDPQRPQPKAVEPGPSPTLGAKPPAGAVVLFDGKDLSAWNGGPWRVADGFMEVNGTGEIVTKQQFGSMKLHLEFATPEKVVGDGQGRGNSGIFLMGYYEVQVLDSWHNPSYADGHVGAAYGQQPPLVNASRPPGEWQSYDITFEAPEFNARGDVVRPPRVTVLLNNVKVQDDYAYTGPTLWRRRASYRAHGPVGPISLQDHGNPVRYRNIWLVPQK